MHVYVVFLTKYRQPNDSPQEVPEHPPPVFGRRAVVTELLRRQLQWCPIAVIHQYIEQQKTPH